MRFLPYFFIRVFRFHNIFTPFAAARYFARHPRTDRDLPGLQSLWIRTRDRFIISEPVGCLDLLFKSVSGSQLWRFFFRILFGLVHLSLEAGFFLGAFVIHNLILLWSFYILSCLLAYHPSLDHPVYVFYTVSIITSVQSCGAYFSLYFIFLPERPTWLSLVVFTICHTMASKDVKVYSLGQGIIKNGILRHSYIEEYCSKNLKRVLSTPGLVPYSTSRPRLISAC